MSFKDLSSKSRDDNKQTLIPAAQFVGRDDVRVRFVHEMRALVDAHPILHHKFFSLLFNPNIAHSFLRFWALQDRHIAYMFPKLIGLIIARLPANNEYTVRARMPLIENLWEESGDGCHESAHSTLMDRLLLSIGVPEAEMCVDPLPTTCRFVDMQFELTEANPMSGIGAFCYANEYLALREYPPIQSAVLTAFPKSDIRFFEANWEADGRHTQLAEQSMTMLCQSEADYTAIRRGATLALEARVNFYDGICQEFNL